MMILTRKHVRKDASSITLCNTELKQEEMISVLADNNSGALTNCSTKRKLAMILRALSIMTMPPDNAVHDPHKENLKPVGAIDRNTPCSEPLND